MTQKNHNHKDPHHHDHDDHHDHTHHDLPHHHSHNDYNDGHHHGPVDYNFKFFVGIALNFGFVIIESTMGFFSNSMALLADAGHNLADVASLFLAWGAFYLAKRKPSARYTYGLKKTSILSAFINSILLLVAVGAIILESTQRLFEPHPIHSTTMMIVAGFGIFINLGTALLFMKDRHHDLNIRGAYMHMLSDALVSVGVVVAGFIIQWTGWLWLDSGVSLIISLIIIWGTWELLQSSFKMSVDAVPEGIDPTAVRKLIQSDSAVQEIHDLHIWPMSTTETALSVHVVIEKNSNQNQMISNLNQKLKDQFNITHSTIQSEIHDDSFHCDLKSDDVI